MKKKTKRHGAWPIIVLATFLTVMTAQAASRSSRWNGEYFPNIALVNQDGKTVRFYDDLIKNKVVAINFIFTSCTYSCPLETAKLRQVETLLGDRVGRDVFMYSISIDPETDTPERLKKYAQKFKTGPGWQFLTGKKAEIDLLRQKLGVLGADAQNEKIDDHNLSFVFGNAATGQMKRSPYDNPKMLAALLGDQLQNYRSSHAGRKNYAQAPELPRLDHGEYLFRTRCQSCHSVGSGDAIGPDLAGVVSKRDRAWLTRWLKEPDRMLAEKDPIAMALYAKYKENPMPNLKLNNNDARALISYLKTESAKVATLGANPKKQLR